MKYTQVAELSIPKISFGCYQLVSDREEAQRTDAERVLKAALEAGVTLFDTAEQYGEGRSEELLGAAFADQREEVLISTKIRPRVIMERGLLSCVEAALRRLRADYIDILFIHAPHPELRIEDVLERMNRLREKGTIRAIGLSNFTGEQIERCLSIARVEVIQDSYNLLWRAKLLGLADIVRKHRLVVMAYNPLADGLLTGRFRKGMVFDDEVRKHIRFFHPPLYDAIVELVDQIRACVAEKHERSVAHVVLSWITGEDMITSTVTGTTTREHIRDNAAAADWPLPAEDRALLERLSRAFRERFVPELDHDSIYTID